MISVFQVGLSVGPCNVRALMNRSHSFLISERVSLHSLFSTGVMLTLYLLATPGLAEIPGITPDSQYTCQVSVDRMPVWNLTVNQTEQLLSGQNSRMIGIPIIDLRPAVEFRSCHLSGAVSLDPASESFDKDFSELNSTSPILVCADRYPEEFMIQCELNEFPGVFYLSGGIDAWVIAGKPVISLDNRSSVGFQDE